MTIYKKKQIRYTERKRLDENRPEYKGGSANGKASGTYRAGGGGAYPKRSGKQDGKSYGENHKEIVKAHLLTYFNFLNLFLAILVLITRTVQEHDFYGSRDRQCGNRDRAGTES